jgi:prepilin-type N-terminal cleavage/methylation domain-containing protein
VSSRPRYRRARGETGLTLIEVLVTVVILGIAFVTVVGGMAVSIAGSDMHRKQAASQTVLRNLAEFMKAYEYVSACPNATEEGGATPPPYSMALQEFSDQVAEPRTAPHDVDPRPDEVTYTVELADMQVWDGGNPAKFLPPPSDDCEDTGLQRLVLKVQSVGRPDLPAEELVVTKRAP